MRDPRFTQLAETLITYSIKAKKNDKVWIRVFGKPAMYLGREVYRKALEVGADPYFDFSDTTINESYYQLAPEHVLSKEPEVDKFLATWADSIVTIAGEENTRLLSHVDPHKLVIRQQAKKVVRDVYIHGKPWVLTYVPSPSLAQEAGMGTEEFEDFYFGAVLRDWREESERIRSLSSQLSGAKEIEVIGKDTHLTLSAKGRIFVPDCGEYNMPGGETFTAPVDDSVEGTVYFNFPLLRESKYIRDIRLWFEKGKVVKATASENEDFLLSILDTDAGSRRLGEFAIGMNPGIRNYMNNMLFDEKIQGTIHMAIGEAYEECKGINTSAIHMDIVKDMTLPGSQVIVDGKEILRDGELLTLPS